MMINPPDRILAFVPNWLGDAAMCTPALRALARRFPNAKLIAVGRRSVCDLLRGPAWLDDTVPIPAQPNVGAMLALRRRLRATSSTLAVVFPHSFRAALAARVTGASTRLGYARNGRSWLLTHKVLPYREDGVIVPVYMGREYLDLVKGVGCKDDGEGLELVADPATVERVRPRLEGDGPLAAVAPGAAFGPSKRWPAERYAAVIDALHNQLGARAVLLTGPGEEDTRDAVLATVKCSPIIADDGHPTIDTLKASISLADILIGNDSGPRHVAIAFKKPVICIMGPTSPHYSAGPYEIGEVLRVDVDCGPCQKPVCKTDFRCMTRIAPETVVAAALRYLPANR
ncbi:MAG: glycosyltransferase family 9 protein [Candidatus Hydrogenedentes bacterium]|nr:glycosyltransferase family 9 protein [Candidatus Hydrogenedentota bacterium]